MYDHAVQAQMQYMSDHAVQVQRQTIRAYVQYMYEHAVQVQRSVHAVQVQRSVHAVQLQRSVHAVQVQRSELTCSTSSLPRPAPHLLRRRTNSTGAAEQVPKPHSAGALPLQHGFRTSRLQYVAAQLRYICGSCSTIVEHLQYSCVQLWYSCGTVVVRGLQYNCGTFVVHLHNR